MANRHASIAVRTQVLGNWSANKKLSIDNFRIARQVLGKRKRTFELPTAELAGTWVYGMP